MILDRIEFDLMGNEPVFNRFLTGKGYVFDVGCDVFVFPGMR